MSAPEASSAELHAGDADVLDSPEAGALVLRGGALRVGGYVAGTLVSLLGVAVVTRYLGVDEYGKYQTILSLVTLVAAVTDVGMATYGLREYTQGRAEERDAMMSTLIGLRLALTTLGIVAALAIGIAAGYSTELEVGILLAGVGLLVTVLQTTLAIPLNAELRIAAITLLDAGRQVLMVVAFLILAAAGAGVAAFLGATIPVALVVLAVTAWLVRGAVSVVPRVRLREWAGMLKATAAFAAATAAGSIYAYTAMILTSFVASAEQAGLFAASFRVIVVTAAVPSLIVTVAFPVLARAARDDRERLTYALQRLFEVSVVLGAATVIGLVIGAPFVIEVLAGPKFAGAVGVLQIQALALMASFLLATWGFGLLSLHRHRPLLLANLLALGLSCVLVLVLASADGARGAALATVISESVLAIAYLVALARGHRDLMPRLGVVPRVIAAATPACAVVLIPGLPALVQAILAVAIFLFLALVFRALPAELADLLPAGARARFQGRS